MISTSGPEGLLHNWASGQLHGCQQIRGKNLRPSSKLGRTIKPLTIGKPDTVIRWHRAGFRSYWRWKSRHRCGRPTVVLEIRRLSREISIANPLWGAPRINGELLKLSIEIARLASPNIWHGEGASHAEGWKTLPRNHANGIVAMDLFVVPTISFRLLYGLLIIGYSRRQILWFG
jgi:hypothetical protein